MLPSGKFDSSFMYNASRIKTQIDDSSMLFQIITANENQFI